MNLEASYYSIGDNLEAAMARESARVFFVLSTSVILKASKCSIILCTSCW
jgi:hypothetical protein